MIVYLANKTRFREDILSNRIEGIVHDSVKGALGKSVGASELASWKHSLRHMDTVLEDAGIPNNAGVAIEFNIPQTGKRVDFIVTGTREDGQRTAVIVELKQWQDARAGWGPEGGGRPRALHAEWGLPRFRPSGIENGAFSKANRLSLSPRPLGRRHA